MSGSPFTDKTRPGPTVCSPVASVSPNTDNWIWSPTWKSPSCQPLPDQCGLALLGFAEGAAEPSLLGVPISLGECRLQLFSGGHCPPTVWKLCLRARRTQVMPTRWRAASSIPALAVGRMSSQHTYRSACHILPLVMVNLCRSGFRAVPALRSGPPIGEPFQCTPGRRRARAERVLRHRRHASCGPLLSPVGGGREDRGCDLHHAALMSCVRRLQQSLALGTTEGGPRSDSSIRRGRRAAPWRPIL